MDVRGFKKAFTVGGLCWLLAAHCLLAQCPDQNITLLTQSDVDAFVADWPDCAELEVDLTLGPQWNGNTDDLILDISNLSGLESIDGILRIRHLTNEDNQPISLAGLQNLHTVKRLHIGVPISFQLPPPSIPVGDLSPLSNIQGELSELMVSHITNDTLLLYLNEVMHIGKFAFNTCPALKRLPAFPSLEKVYMLQVGNTGIDSLFLPESLTRIGFPDDAPETSEVWGFLAPALEVFSNPQLNHLEHSGGIDYLPSLFVQYNTLLESIAGFEQTVVLDGDFYVHDNDHLRGLTAFTNLDSVSGKINLHGIRPEIFDALHNLRFAQAIGLQKYGDLGSDGPNDMQVNIGMLSDSLYIITPGFGKSFELTVYTLDSLNVHINSSLSYANQTVEVAGSMRRLHGLQHLREVAGLIRFNVDLSTTLPHCPSLIGAGSMQLRITRVDTLTGFNALETIEGILGIRSVSLTADQHTTKAIDAFHALVGTEIIILQGLSVLEDISGFAPMLTHIEGGFSSLPNLRFLDLPSLSNFSGIFNSLTVMDGPIEFRQCGLVDSFPSFPAIEGSHLIIGGNPNLTHTDFLQNISALSGLEITNHPNLTSVTAHPDVTFSGPLVIEGNEALSSCANESLCHMIAQAGSVDISGNGSNCNGAESILEACTQLGTDGGGPADIRIWNDGQGVLHLSAANCYFEGAMQVIDLTGRTQRSAIAVKDLGVQVPIAGLASGVYVVHGRHCGSPFAQKVFLAK